MLKSRSVERGVTIKPINEQFSVHYRDLKNNKILIVEDERINQFVCERMVSTLGLQSGLAVHGREAIEFLKERQYALVLMDCQMPVMDGYTATAEIRRKEKEAGQCQT